jgi:hypothetical protein
MNQEIFEKYRKFQEKFDLPNFYELEKAFKIDVHDNEKLIDEIRNEISDRIFNFSERILEPLFNDPEAMCCIFEQDMITSSERKTLFEMYRKIQALKWENNYLTIYPNDKKTAEWIKKAWDLWNNQLQAELAGLCKKLSLSWTFLRFTDEKTQYHG